jgi:hydrogenase/urease accessory protein HupE
MKVVGIILALVALGAGGWVGYSKFVAEKPADSFVLKKLDRGQIVQTVAATGTIDVFGRYGTLGVRHILLGVDHLMFVLLLVLLVPQGRRLVATITAFTVGHSVTLALSTLGAVSVPVAPVEATIAMSIGLLAVEVTRRTDAPDTLTKRAPWLVATAFGLLHGLGFASALHQVGLPDAEIPAALFAFNVGVEAGQLAFVAVVLLVRAALARLVREPPRWGGHVVPYAVGAAAVFFTLERLAALGS